MTAVHTYGSSLAWVLLAAGSLIVAMPGATRRRVDAIAPASREADGIGTALRSSLRRLRRLLVPARLSAYAGKRLAAADADAFRLAASWDLLAACLHAGMPVPAAVRASASAAPEAVERVLLGAADLLALGADPTQAWEQARACPETAEFARAACRTARSGATLAEVAADLAARTRRSTTDKAHARAQRAAVLVTGPLGLCFLPAFLCLGVIPVVLGLASRLTALR